MATDTGGGSAHRVTAIVTATAVVSSMPAFLVGALASYITRPLDAGPGTIGAAVAIFFGASAAISLTGGRRAQRFGVQRALLASLAISMISLVLLAVAPLTRGWLFASLVVGGIGHGTGHPAASLALFADGTADDRRPLRFGIKQAAIPIASLLAGVSVPMIAATIGWRWAFGAAAGLAAVPMAGLSVVPSHARTRAADAGGMPARSNQALRTMAGAAALGAGAATSLPAFLTTSATEAGMAAADAGWLLAGGSIVGIVARLLVGWTASSDGLLALRTVALMLILGSFGFVLLAQSMVGALALGTFLAFSLAWGWTGLFSYSIVEVYPGHAGLASGMGQAGASAGAAAGPLLFGLIASASSFSHAWLAAAVTAVTAGVAMLVARSWRQPGRPSAEGG